jgi:two-component system, sensor histidine kinase PdtaS
VALIHGEAPPSAREDRRDQSLTDHLPVMVMRAGADALCDYVNHAWVEFTGRPLETQLGLGWLEAVHPDDREGRLAAFAAAAAAGAPLAIEYRLRRHDGAYRWVSERCAPLLDGAGYACCGLDVSAERRLRRAVARAGRALRQREMLLTELAHRAKNTVQMIGSLLALLARQVPPAVGAKVREMAGRVRAFGLAHEALGRGRGAGSIELGSYLGDVTEGLRELARDRSVAIEIRGEPVMVAAGRASSLGLLVNELVTNALKHGFPGDRAGRVTVEVRRLEGGRAEVAVADDGIGLPEGAWPPKGTASLGLPLIAGLARQAQAEVTVGRNGNAGTRFALVFAVADAAPSAIPEVSLRPA